MKFSREKIAQTCRGLRAAPYRQIVLADADAWAASALRSQSWPKLGGCNGLGNC